MQIQIQKLCVFCRADVSCGGMPPSGSLGGLSLYSSVSPACSCAPASSEKCDVSVFVIVMCE